MRVYVFVDSDVALELLEHGWRDLHPDPDFRDREGVFCQEEPTALYPEMGTTVLCIDIPEDVFRPLEVQTSTYPLSREQKEQHLAGLDPEGVEYRRLGYATIPAEILNRYGLPKLYDHEFATASRVRLIQAIRSLEAAAAPREHIEGLRKAIRFLDRVGWQTPLALQEEQ
jgi:hypothetical protein